MNKMYIKRRHEEIKILNEYLKYNINMQVNSSFKDVYNLKMFLRNKLREKYFNYMDLTSMNSGDVVKENGIAYKFKYQRFDGQCIVDFEKNVIPVITDCKEQKTYWTTSGMGAITSLLCSIHLMKKYHFIYTKDIYFESIQLIERLHLNDMNIYNVVYLDSIQINFYECFSTLKDINAKFAILDSTCLDYKNEEMIIAELCRKFSACVVIKSHTKLDMLGTEFSQLGSITYYIGENIENTTSRYIKNIYELNIELIRHLGIFAKPFDIPVFWNHDDFMEINTRRISKIKECNTYAFNQMKLKTYKILKLPQHQLFVLVDNVRDDNKILENKIKDIISFERKDKNIPVFFASGFGFDYIAIDMYYDYFNMKYYIRIAFGDIGKDIIKEFVKDFTRAYNEI